MDQFTPSSFVAGAVLADPGNERTSVFHAAAGLLDSERLRFVYSCSNGMVYFLAAPSTDFGTAPDSVSPLDSALPGMHGHRGDGAYVAAISASMEAAVVVAGRRVQSFAGSPEAVARFVGSLNVSPTIRVSVGSAPWTGFDELERRESERLARLSFKAGVVGLVVGFCIWGAAGVLQSMADSGLQRSIQSQRASLVSAVASLNSSAVSISDPLAEHTRLFRAIRSYGTTGRLTSFKYDGGRMTWEADLPAWTTQEQIAKLGQGLQVTSDSGAIVVKKGVF